MRIGVVSDTHNHLRNVERIVELFNAAGVDRVVHTGDITQARTLAVLGRLQAPLVGVYGNNDVEREALATAAADQGFQLAEPPLELSWHGRQIVVVHDPRELDGALRPEHQVALHGHTHLRVEERSNGRLVFNPGECAGHLTGHNAIGVLDLELLTTEILLF
ncbi:MAG: YfcE family phosphodiesterase [Proteobacteria bacterium]|nr:YfcE family phosphodiesterase [Pseudomonadota bacterium]